MTGRDLTPDEVDDNPPASENPYTAEDFDGVQDDGFDD